MQCRVCSRNHLNHVHWSLLNLHWATWESGPTHNQARRAWRKHNRGWAGLESPRSLVQYGLRTSSVGDLATRSHCRRSSWLCPIDVLTRHLWISWLAISVALQGWERDCRVCCTPKAIRNGYARRRAVLRPSRSSVLNFPPVLATPHHSLSYVLKPELEGRRIDILFLLHTNHRFSNSLSLRVITTTVCASTLLSRSSICKWVQHLVVPSRSTKIEACQTRGVVRVDHTVSCSTSL